MQFTVNLQAGQFKRQETAGSYFMILDDGGAGPVDVVLRDGPEVLEEIRTASKGTKLRMPPGKRFTAVDLKTGGAAALEVVISEGLVDIDLFAGAAVNATIVGPHTGTPADPISVSAVTVADTPASAINTLAPVACGPVAAVIKAANANCRTFYITNFGPDPVAVGGAGITWATRGAFVLNSGDTLPLDKGGNLAWSAITDAGKAASVGVSEVVQ